MNTTRRLDELLRNAARRDPAAPALRVNRREVSYGQLDRMADEAAAVLENAGVKPGDRVGVWLDKSAGAVAAMQGALRLGAAYVPIDPQSPGIRAAAIITDCAMACVVTTPDRSARIAETGAAECRRVTLGDSGDELRLNGEPGRTGPERAISASAQDLAYILYTSGSTGKPKGVSISHRAALAFVDWAVAFVDARSDDRFANHAPFHFDLSVLDLYAAFSVGACVCIVPEGSAYAPGQLVQFLSTERIAIWYSVPSVLVLMIEQGDLLDVEPLPLRHLLFAGEPFPIQYVRTLQERWPALPMHNLYGPTETNVCTAFTVGDIDPKRTRPVPIGKATCGDRVWAVTDAGAEAEVGQEGELWVSGPTVMLGYWGHPPQGDRPYPTGDLVRRIDAENFDYVGRRDQMLKVRGHRIEAGEVEACLLAHPGVREAAVVVGGEGLKVKLFAFLVATGEPPGIIALKTHCAARLPRSMIIDAVRWLPQLPRTRNGKVDRLELQQRANQPRE